MTGRVERFLGKGGIYIIRKFFGIILLAISVRLFTANITSVSYTHLGSGPLSRTRMEIGV